MVGSNEAGSDDDAHAQHTHTPTSDDDVLSHSPARVCRAKADAIASGEATVGDKLREELGDLLSVLRGVDVFNVEQVPAARLPSGSRPGSSQQTRDSRRWRLKPFKDYRGLSVGSLGDLTFRPCTRACT